MSYDGTDFSGFQSLPDRRTVQGDLREALSKHCGEPIHPYGAGRTDAGVHAGGQAVHFDTGSATPPDRYPMAMARFLRRDLAILASREAPPGFHARHSAIGRIYRYAIAPGRRSPLTGRFAWMPAERPDWDRLEAECERLAQTRDFRQFALAGSEGPTERRLTRVELRRGPGVGWITFEAPSFLRGMVRWMVAALWRRATGRMSDGEWDAMLAGESRPERLVPAPPQGLCLVGVRYREPLFRTNPDAFVEAAPGKRESGEREGSMDPARKRINDARGRSIWE